MQKPIVGKDFPLFFQGYIDLVPYHENPYTLLSDSLDVFKNDLNKIQLSDFLYAYAENKWNIGQVIRHCIDTERIFSYRALCIARKDLAPIRSFNENEYAIAAGTIHDSASLSEEFYAVRYSTALFFDKLDPQNTGQHGTFENGENISLKAMAYIIAGHWNHHKNILTERYQLLF